MSARLVALPVDDPRCGQLSLRLRAALWLICGVAGPGGIVPVLGRDHVAGLARLLGASDSEGRSLHLDVGALAELGELRLEAGAIVVRALAGAAVTPPAAPPPPAQAELKLSPPSGKVGGPSAAPAPARSRRKPEGPLPAGWGPDATAYAVGGERGLSREAVDAQAEQFRDHALTHARRCVEWHAAFRNWLRKIDPPGPVEEGEPTEPPDSPGSRRSTATAAGGPVAEVAALMREHAGADPSAEALAALEGIGAAAPSVASAGDPWRGVKLAGAAPAPTMMVAGVAVGTR